MLNLCDNLCGKLKIRLTARFDIRPTATARFDIRPTATAKNFSRIFPHFAVAVNPQHKSGLNYTSFY